MSANPPSGQRDMPPLGDQRHALRARLACLRLYADLLASGRADRREHYLAVLHSELDRLSELVDRLGDGGEPR